MLSNADYEFYTLYSDGFRYYDVYDISYTAKTYYVIPLIEDTEEGIYIYNHGGSTGDTMTLTTSGNFLPPTVFRQQGFNSTGVTITNQSGNALGVEKVDNNRLEI